MNRTISHFRHPSWPVWIPVLVCLTVARAQDPATGKTSPTSPPAPQDLLYDSLAAPSLVESQALRLDSIVLFRGGQELAFHQGSLRLFKPVGGKTFGGLFRGTGALTLTPPTKIELEELETRFKFTAVKGTIVVPFKKAVLWFEPSLIGDLGSNLPAVTAAANDDDREDVAESAQFATDKWNDNVVYSLANELRHRTPHPYLFCQLFLDRGKMLFLTFNTRRFEEIAIEQTVTDHIANLPERNRYLDIPERTLTLVSSFHSAEEYLDKTEYALTAEDKRSFDYLGCDIDLTLRKSGQTTGKAVLSLRSLDGSRYLPFVLDPSLEVDSVVTTGGTRLPVLRPEDSWVGRVLVPEPDSGPFKLTFYYAGEFFKTSGREGFVIWNNSGSLNEPASSTGWYPQSTFSDRMAFDVSYRYPSDLTLVSAGRKLSDTTIGEDKVSRYRLPREDINCSFVAGKYQVLEYRHSEADIPITLYHIGYAQPELMVKNLGVAFNLYTFLFGKSSYEVLKAVSVPSGHGEAHLEFVKLPTFDEFMGEGGNSVAIAKAHEVAHSWWGYDVGWRSYHDIWLSEGISTYAALLYGRFVLNEDKQLFALLEEWKRAIGRERGYQYEGKEDPVKPIWLGSRVSTSRSGFEYSLSVYRKGAWVMHMLRMMMVDLTTMKEDAYKAMIQDFFATFKGKDASTEGLIAVAGKHIGTDMTWFFDQWLQRPGVPTLTWGKTITKSPEGKYVLELTVDQSDTDDPFLLLVPFEITFADGTTARARLQVTQLKNSFRYELAQEPETVTMNILQSVLCRLEEK